MPEITKQQLIDAGTDAQALEDIVNGSAVINGDGYVDTRTGGPVKTVSKVLADAQTVLDDANNAASTIVSRYLYDNPTSMASPGTGTFRLNNATIASATAMAIMSTTNETGNPSIDDYLDSWDDSTNAVKGYIFFRKKGTPGTFAIFRITGALTDNTTWKQIPIAYIAGAGSWTDGDEFYIGFTRNGDASGGDVSSNFSSGVDGELVVQSGTGGKTLKRANGITGLLKAIAGVVSAAVAGTDYAIPGANNDITSMTALASINSGQIAGFRNKIINGAFNISERVIGTTDNSYTLDRWRLLLEAANAATVTRNSASTPTGFKYNLKATVGSGNNNKFGIWQVIEGINVYDLRGKTVTLSAKLKATAGLANVKMAIVEFTGTEDAVSGDPISTWGADSVNPTLAASYAFGNTPANLSVTTSWADYSVSYTVGASATNLAVFIWNDDKTTTTSTDQLDIGAVQLEIGSVKTLFEQRPIGLELSLCQRYFKKIGNATSGCYFGNGVNYNNTTDGLCVLHYTKGRTTPTCSVSAAGDFEVFQVNPGTTKTLTTFSISGVNSDCVFLAVGGWTSGTANSGILLRSLNTSAAIYLDMEL